MTESNSQQIQSGPPSCAPANCSTIRASATRKSNAWYPTLEYSHGGRVIGDIQCGTMEEAVGEAERMIQCMADYPSAFLLNHPDSNQLIDLSNGDLSSEAKAKL